MISDFTTRLSRFVGAPHLLGDADAEHGAVVIKAGHACVARAAVGRALWRPQLLAHLAPWPAIAAQRHLRDEPWIHGEARTEQEQRGDA